MKSRLGHPSPRPLLLGALLGLALVGAARAAPNGLTQIPVAKVFGDGVASFSVARVVQSSQTTTYTAQYGLGNVFEFGADYQAALPEQRTLLGDVKYLVAHHPGRLPDIAFGMVNVATGQRAVPYAVATTQPSALGVSLGVIRPSGSGYEGMGGLAYSVTPTVRIAADEIGGAQNYGTLGVIAGLTKTLTLNVAYARPNGAGDPQGYVVNLAYTLHLKGSGKSQDGTQNANPTAGRGSRGQAGGNSGLRAMKSGRPTAPNCQEYVDPAAVKGREPLCQREAGTAVPFNTA